MNDDCESSRSQQTIGCSFESGSNHELDFILYIYCSKVSLQEWQRYTQNDCDGYGKDEIATEVTMVVD